MQAKKITLVLMPVIHHSESRSADSSWILRERRSREVQYIKRVNSDQGLFYDMLFTNMESKANSEYVLHMNMLRWFIARMTLKQRNTAILFVLRAWRGKTCPFLSAVRKRTCKNMLPLSDDWCVHLWWNKQGNKKGTMTCFFHSLLLY